MGFFGDLWDGVCFAALLEFAGGVAFCYEFGFVDFSCVCKWCLGMWMAVYFVIYLRLTG